MKALLRSWIVVGLAAFVMVASTAASVATAQDRVKYRQEELDQMLAPIALYPDPLLSQILMASTYPLEVVEAARWSKANPGLKGQDAVSAVDSMEWDPSVKSLAAFPQVLAMMDSKLEWTESLGEAFIGQQEDVMNSVQGLRRKAEAAGNLLSSDQMRVGREGDYITIDPPAPQIVYVPYYDPTVVYGAWWWPAYPPVYWAPPAYYVGPAYRPGFYWGSGIAISATFFFGHTDWRHRRVTVVNNQVNNVTVNRTVVNNRTVISNAPARSRVAWQPDPAHRRGAPFHREAARQRFEQHAAAAGVATRNSAGNGARSSVRSAAPASPSVQQQRPRPEQRSNAVQEKREARRPERRDPAQSRAAPQEQQANVIQGGQRAQPSAQQQQAARAQAEARRRQAPAPQAAESRVETRQAPRPQAQTNTPRPQAQPAPHAAPHRPERQAERREAPRAQPQSHAPRAAPAQPRPEARNNGGPPSHAPAASPPRPAVNHPPARPRGNQQQTERGPRGRDG
ncbi:MAG TPA: DUF3300 domain-containing protein [Burkholderiales bacterium]|nr:DUF3300 domain-containing protein [Burkholderiales bacterium]